MREREGTREPDSARVVEGMVRLKICLPDLLLAGVRVTAKVCARLRGVTVWRFTSR